MSEDPVTVATFGDLTQAIAARNLLEADGIRAFIADEHLVGSLFIVAAAVGAIKLQVPSSQLDRALQLLDDRMPVDSPADAGAELDFGRPEEQDGVTDTPSDLDASDPEPLPDDRTVREQRADRLLRGAVIGVFIAPVMLLAFWRLAQIYLSHEQLRPAQQRKAFQAAALILPFTFLNLLAYLMMCCSMFVP